MPFVTSATRCPIVSWCSTSCGASTLASRTSGPGSPVSSLSPPSCRSGMTWPWRRSPWDPTPALRRLLRPPPPPPCLSLHLRLLPPTPRLVLLLPGRAGVGAVVVVAVGFVAGGVAATVAVVVGPDQEVGPTSRSARL